MTEHHPNCEDATGAYPGSCTCKTIAMDNLIAQDADLIDSPLVDRLRDFVIAEDIDLAADRIEALEAEIRRKDAALRLFLALVDDPDYDFGELCEEFVPIARAALGEKQ